MKRSAENRQFRFGLAQAKFLNLATSQNALTFDLVKTSTMFYIRPKLPLV